MVVRSALSAVPDKPLGLYDPAFDKDSCGVGFVAELSGESSRKTVSMIWWWFGHECGVMVMEIHRLCVDLSGD